MCSSDLRQVMVPKGDGFFREPPMICLPKPLPTALPRPIAKPSQALQGLSRPVLVGGVGPVVEIDLERPSTPLPSFQSIREGEAGGSDAHQQQ